MSQTLREKIESLPAVVTAGGMQVSGAVDHDAVLQIINDHVHTPADAMPKWQAERLRLAAGGADGDEQSTARYRLLTALNVLRAAMATFARNRPVPEPLVKYLGCSPGFWYAQRAPRDGKLGVRMSMSTANTLSTSWYPLDEFYSALDAAANGICP